MSKRKLAAMASTALLLGLAGTASGQPADDQYGGVGGEQPGGGEVAAAAGEGGLPFTGFHAALVALGGAGIAATGLVLRRMGRNKSS
jgi:hypothetical protein